MHNILRTFSGKYKETAAEHHLTQIFEELVEGEELQDLSNYTRNDILDRRRQKRDVIYADPTFSNIGRSRRKALSHNNGLSCNSIDSQTYIIKYRLHFSFYFFRRDIRN